MKTLITFSTININTKNLFENLGERKKKKLYLSYFGKNFLNWSKHYWSIILDPMLGSMCVRNKLMDRQTDVHCAASCLLEESNRHNRFSKSCNCAVARLLKMCENIRKIVTNECQTGKNGTNFIFLSKLDKVFMLSWHFLCMSLRKIFNQKLLAARKNYILESLRHK